MRAVSSTWQHECRRQLEMLVAAGGCFQDLARDSRSRDKPQLHLAVFLEPYLTFILEGKKTVESRFSSVRCAPYKKVHTGDFILLKGAGGPVTGLCRVEAAWFYTVNSQTLNEIRSSFAQQICPAESDFWSARAGSSFATLISLIDVKPLSPFCVGKRDRRGWVTLS